MAKKKLSVSHNGQTFTRTTERIYTHVILVRNDYQRDRESAIRHADHQARLNHPYYVRESDPATREYERSAETQARYAEAATMTIDQFAQLAMDRAAAEIDARHAAGEFDKFGMLEWCGRMDLARNAHGKAMKHGFAEVVIVPVPAA